MHKEATPSARNCRLICAPVCALVLSLAAVLTAPNARALDDSKFAMLTVGISRAAAAEFLGTPDSEICTATLAVRVCRLEWKPISLFSPKISYRAVFVYDKLISKSTCQPASECASKE